MNKKNILFVWNTGTGTLPVFINEQIDSLKRNGYSVDLYEFKYSGISGYISNYYQTMKMIKVLNKYDLIHAHFGLTGFIMGLIPVRPLIVTYHGSDINNPILKIFSTISSLLSSHNIFVNDQMVIGPKQKNTIIQCGVDLNIFHPIQNLKYKNNVPMILFGSSPSRKVKNYPFALKVIEYIKNNYGDVELRFLEGIDRQTVNSLINEADCCILTSKWEGSPQFIKEAMSCNSPIVSADVGDVKVIISEVEGCSVVDLTNENSVQIFGDKVVDAIRFRKEKKYTTGRKKIIDMGLDIDQIATRIIEVYRNIL